MFSGDKTKLKEIKTSNVTTIIGEGTEIQGDVIFSGGLHIDGKVIGNIRADQSDPAATLTLSESGMVKGNVDVPVVVLDGEVQGDVCVISRVQLASKARISGNVTYNLIEMAVGAEVNGQLLRQEAGAAKAPAAKPGPASKTQPAELSAVKAD